MRCGKTRSETTGKRAAPPQNHARCRSSVCRQAADRRGKDIRRVGIGVKRKDDFHQVRMYISKPLSAEY